MRVSRFQEMVKDRGACLLQSMGSQRVRHDLVTATNMLMGHQEMLGFNVCCVCVLTHVRLFVTHGLYPTRLPCLWSPPAKNNGMG